MKIEITPSEDDYLAYQLFAASQSERIQKKTRRSKWIISIFFFLCAVFNYMDGQNIFLTIYFAVLGLACIVFYKRYERWIYKRHYRKYGREVYSKKFDQVAEIDFTEETLISKDFTGEAKYNYSEFDFAAETDNHFFIIQSTGAGIILPKPQLSNIDDIRNEMLSRGIPIEDYKGWKW